MTGKTCKMFAVKMYEPAAAETHAAAAAEPAKAESPAEAKESTEPAKGEPSASAKEAGPAVTGTETSDETKAEEKAPAEAGACKKQPNNCLPPAAGDIDIRMLDVAPGTYTKEKIAASEAMRRTLGSFQKTLEDGTRLFIYEETCEITHIGPKGSGEGGVAPVLFYGKIDHCRVFFDAQK